MFKILVTGTHFTTALAVIEELRKYPDIQTFYVGRATTMEGDLTLSVESQVLPRKGIKFIPIITGRLQKSFSDYTILSLLKIPIGFIQSAYIISKEKPDLILSFGGYVSVPVILMGWLLSIPIMIHEQTLVTGLANKIGGIFANKIAVSFTKSHEFPKEKVILTGNPIRADILNTSNNSSYVQKIVRTPFRGVFRQARMEKLPVILVTGGNQGSHIINKVIERCLEKLLKVACVIHQTGDSKFKDYERLKNRENKKYIVAKFIDRYMPYVLKNCDLVISRAGINTLTELAYLEKSALVIPIPYLYKDEQSRNAKFFEQLGLVKILPQSRLNPESLLEEVGNMLKNIEYLKIKAKKAKSVVFPDAAKSLALEVILMLEQKNK